MIDLHTHLLPGVDDGARSPAQACAALERLAAEGVRTVCLTPHLRASDVRAGRVPNHGAALQALARATPTGVTLVRGFELMLDEPGVALASPALALGGSRAVLVEFARGPIPVAAERELARLRDDGVVPVVAHPERHVGATPGVVAAWRAAGARVQGDATTLCGRGARAQAARALLAAGLYDVLASDNHGDARTLAAARDLLVARGAPEAATLLTEVNPGRILRDEAPLPVPPVALAPGPIAWLRDRLAARRGGPAGPSPSDLPSR